MFGVDEKYIEEFTKEYVMASNAVIIKQESNIKTRNNLIPQDLKSIIRPKKLVDFIDSFLIDDVNIAYIYGYSLSGKTKSVMAYIKDLINRNVYENIMWQDMKETNQKEQIINLILKFAVDNKENIDKGIQEKICMNFIEKTKSLIILDFCEYEMKFDMLEILKEVAKYAKVILISTNSFKKYENKLSYYTKIFSTNNFIEKQEFEQILKINLYENTVLDNNEMLIKNLYAISGGVPFIAIYILKRIIEDSKMGIPLNDAIKTHINYETSDYKEISAKIIEKVWKNLGSLARKILITCSKFKNSISCKLVAYICDSDITSKEWRNALKELYDNDLITCIILNSPRFKVNNMIKILVLSYSKEEYDENLFINQIAKYYIDLSTYIGECYNNLYKLNLLDDIDEWDIILEVLEYLNKFSKYKEYINIVRELKYYIYVRGMWNQGEESLHLKRVNLARKINNKNEELEGICDYINICSKAKNSKEAEKYLEIVEKIVEENSEKIDKRIICLYFHVKALYLNNCLGEYEEAYEIWKNNRERYFDYVNEYRRLVNRLWEDRCYFKIEKDIDKVCNKLIESHSNAINKNFTRGIIDYELLIANKIIEKYEKTKKQECLKEATKWLEKAKQNLDKNRKDIRNEAFYYKLKAIISSYEDSREMKEKFIKQAIELYSLMNCKQDILFLENL